MLAQEIYSFVTFGLIVGLGCFSSYFLHRINVNPVPVSDEPLGLFIAANAFRDLKALNDFGPKVVGSHTNEVLAFDYIFNKLNALRSASEHQSLITIDHQIVSGDNFGFVVYRNLQNIVARIEGESPKALMLNCHFDSVAGSPGAGDDAIMVAVMIEIFRIISKSSERQKFSIIFLFNGGEEEDLLAAHGFITQHRWAKDIQAFINLDSGGNDGNVVLFRTGPKHDWLMKAFRQSVPLPYTFVLAEEIYDTGTIPSRSDFQIFRDDGGIPGFDFVHYANSWRYHTEHDRYELISMESIQQTGESILALTKAMANREEMEDPPEGSLPVFYDYLGLFMVLYSKSVGVGLNISISLLAVLVPFGVQTKLLRSNVGFVAIETFVSFLTILLSVILSAVCCFLMALIMNAADNAMSWFNTIFLSIGIYGALALLVQISTYHLIQRLSSKLLAKSKKAANLSKPQRMQIHLNGVNLFWACITLMLTIMGFRLAAVMMVILFVALCTNIFTYTLCKFMPKTRSHSWIVIHLIGHSFTFLWLCNMMVMLLDAVIALTGRVFYSNPDILIAAFCLLWTILCLSYFVPLTRLVPKRAVLYSTLITILITSLILSFTSVGEPYSDSKTDPRVQRLRVFHMKRTFYDHLGAQTTSDVGYLISTYDRNAFRTLDQSYKPEELLEWEEDEKCELETYCGFPLFRFTRGRYIKGSEPPTVGPARFTLLQKTRSQNNPSQIVVDFSLEISLMTLIYFTPGPGWTYVNGTIPSDERLWREKPFRFTKVVHGIKADAELTGSLTLEETPGADPLNAVKITLITVESVFEKSAEFQAVTEKLPGWAFAQQHQVDMSSFTVAGL